MKPTSLNWIVGALLAATAAVASAGPVDAGGEMEECNLVQAQTGQCSHTT